MFVGMHKSILSIEYSNYMYVLYILCSCNILLNTVDNVYTVPGELLISAYGAVRSCNVNFDNVDNLIPKCPHGTLTPSKPCSRLQYKTPLKTEVIV